MLDSFWLGESSRNVSKFRIRLLKYKLIQPIICQFRVKKSAMFRIGPGWATFLEGKKDRVTQLIGSVFFGQPFGSWIKFPRVFLTIFWETNLKSLHLFEKGNRLKPNLDDFWVLFRRWFFFFRSCCETFRTAWGALGFSIEENLASRGF